MPLVIQRTETQFAELLPVCVIIHGVSRMTGIYDKLLKTKDIKSDYHCDSPENFTR